MQLPEIVSNQEWRDANAALIGEEKAHTRARDALAAKRRRQPMTELDASYAFDGPEGATTLLELFEGRRQLILYHFMFEPGGEPCSGCSMFTDQVGHLAHLHARDTTFALASRAPQAEVAPFEQRMGWEMPWYTVLDPEFRPACGLTGGGFALNVFLRDGDRVFLTYATTSRGVEALGSVWTFLDLTPLGRQEEWEETPAGRPQEPAYSWWQLHDEYAQA